MVSISVETPAETDQRLRRLLPNVRLTILPGTYQFVESAIEDRLAVHPDAIAIVRDDAVWSQLVPSHGQTIEAFDVWRFQFPSGLDNSGFVGWLASHIKAQFGSGVIVICGSNSADGGIFDYWGAPAGKGAEIIDFIGQLSSETS